MSRKNIVKTIGGASLAAPAALNRASPRFAKSASSSGGCMLYYPPSPCGPPAVQFCCAIWGLGGNIVHSRSLIARFSGNSTRTRSSLLRITRFARIKKLSFLLGNWKQSCTVQSYHLDSQNIDQMKKNSISYDYWNSLLKIRLLFSKHVRDPRSWVDNQILSFTSEASNPKQLVFTWVFIWDNPNWKECFKNFLFHSSSESLKYFMRLNTKTRARANSLFILTL